MTRHSSSGPAAPEASRFLTANMKSSTCGVGGSASRTAPQATKFEGSNTAGGHPVVPPIPLITAHHGQKPT